jgi:hypothetical protein
VALGEIYSGVYSPYSRKRFPDNFDSDAHVPRKVKATENGSMMQIIMSATTRTTLATLQGCVEAQPEKGRTPSLPTAKTGRGVYMVLFQRQAYHKSVNIGPVGKLAPHARQLDMYHDHAIAPVTRESHLQRLCTNGALHHSHTSSSESHGLGTCFVARDGHNCLWTMLFTWSPLAG